MRTAMDVMIAVVAGRVVARSRSAVARVTAASLCPDACGLSEVSPVVAGRRRDPTARSEWRTSRQT